jgi:quercetin dioxygenase-like cupin family protein/catechol 2,3-dioxygenase-like lactoylglutathione lyase family enzyme
MRELAMTEKSAGYPPERANDMVGNVVFAEVRLPCKDLQADLLFFTKKLGFRLDMIFPADDPAVAVISGYGTHIRLERGATISPASLRLICNDAEAFAGGAPDLHAPNGTRIEIVDARLPLRIPKSKYAFVVHRLRDNASWGMGRAGMQYRDLIPGRLGGFMIASHIRIPQGGSVPDMVHYHGIGFQLIFCYKGWVRVVYEDQWAPFVLKAGECLLQPLEIRHRVLEASEMHEVIEIGLPARHVTSIDHQLNLPTAVFKPERDFRGQKFCRDEVRKAVWNPWRLAGFFFRETGICRATAGIASVQVARNPGSALARVTSHAADVLFSFVTQGQSTLLAEGQRSHVLRAGDAFVIPPNLKTSLSNCSEELELLEVTLPGNFKTIVHAGAKLAHDLI